MSDMTYDEVLELAQQLSEAEQLSLISQLATQIKFKRPSKKPIASLYGKYALKMIQMLMTRSKLSFVRRAKDGKRN